MDFNFRRQKILLSLLILVLCGGVIFLARHVIKKTYTPDPTSVSFKEEKVVNNLPPSVGYGLGLEFGHAGRIWLNSSDGYSSVFSGTGELINTKVATNTPELVPLKVKIEGTPTGMVFSDDNSFDKNFFKGDAFIFPTREGKIFGWSKDKITKIEPLIATLRVDNSTSSSYTGITSADTRAGERLFVADNKNNKIEVYDENYNKIEGTSFTDKNLDPNYSVFNLKAINENIYVTYKNNNNEGGSIINVFDLNGNFIKTLFKDFDYGVSFYGLAITPANFGNIGNLLLVGDSLNGEIIVLDPITGKKITTFKNEKGDILKIDGLNTLTFGTNNGAGRSNELFVSTKTGFSKLQIIFDDHPQSLLQKEGSNANLNEAEIIEKEFLEQDNFKIKFEDFNNDLNLQCLEVTDSCVQDLIVKKETELNLIYNKIFTDSDILKAEFAAQNLDAGKTDKLKIFLAQLKNLDPKKWIDLHKSECQIYGNNIYAGTSLNKMQNICILYRLQNWLKELYTLRSIFIRVELGPLGPTQNIKTEEFKNLIKEEEDRVEKSY